MTRKLDRVSREPDREPRRQYAVLPWRRGADGAVEVLLITSRETRRWVIPKGWPIKGLKPGPSAAREAFEEAGIQGATSKRALGLYHYDKVLRTGRIQHVRVLVFGLEVAEELPTWPEVGQREKLWISVREAADLVNEPELQTLIRAFRP